MEKLPNGDRVLIKYVRKYDVKTGNYIPIGCVVAINKNKFGWSLCGKKDLFVKKMAKKIAINRAYHGSNVYIPDIIWEELHDMRNRAERYFK